MFFKKIKNRFLLITSILLIFSHTAWANLQSIVSKSGLGSSNLSLLVENIQSDKSLLSLNAQKSVIPASLTKIVTAMTIFEHLPLDYELKTSLYLDTKKIKNETLTGDLYLKGWGDPTFTSERMWYLVNEFKRNGINKIRGNVVVDNNFFSQIVYKDNRLKNSVARAYEAPASASSFNWNSVNIYIREKDKKAIVIADPENTFISIINKVKVSKSKRTKIKIARKTLKDKNQIIVSGIFNPINEEKVFYRNVTLPEIWSGNVLRSFLKQRGIDVDGRVRLGSTPDNAIEVASAPGAKLSEVVNLMMKFSNNFISEMMTLHLSKKIGTGKMAEGIQVIEDFFKKYSAKDKNSLVIKSSSGLSRKNRFSMHNLIQLMKIGINNKKYGPELLSSFPISGVDGTLKSRLEGIRGYVRAKTGLLSGVVGLSGIVYTQKGSTLLFGFVYNGPKSVFKVQSFFDKLVIELFEKY